MPKTQKEKKWKNYICVIYINSKREKKICTLYWVKCPHTPCSLQIPNSWENCKEPDTAIENVKSGDTASHTQSLHSTTLIYQRLQTDL